MKFTKLQDSMIKEPLKIKASNKDGNNHLTCINHIVGHCWSHDHFIRNSDIDSQWFFLSIKL